jgi:hypothetical protein
LQNRYVGDVGDFGKYGLLKVLCRPVRNDGPALRLGVVWYLTPDEAHNNDGRFTEYLEQASKNHLAFRACDSDLYDSLGAIVRGGKRNVAAIRQGRILPESTVYYEPILDLKRDKLRSTRAARLQGRQEWVKGAFQATEGYEAVFVDPDNGIGSTSQAYSTRGAKYVLLEEVKPFLDRGQTFVIYHHLNRQAPADIQINQQITRVRQCMGASTKIIARRYRRGSSRVFFALSREPQVARLLKPGFPRSNQLSWI